MINVGCERNYWDQIQPLNTLATIGARKPHVIAQIAIELRPLSFFKLLEIPPAEGCEPSDRVRRTPKACTPMYDA